MKFKSLIAMAFICFGFLFSPYIASCNEPIKVKDFDTLSNFFKNMGTMYTQIKKLSRDLSEGKISADTYRSKMHRWKKDFDEKDDMSPCPKNNWHAYYSELTPIHYDICSAWADLGAIHTSLMTSDSQAVISHETYFRENIQAITDKFEHPELNKMTETPFK